MAVVTCQGHVAKPCVTASRHLFALAQGQARRFPMQRVLSMAAEPQRCPARQSHHLQRLIVIAPFACSCQTANGAGSSLHLPPPRHLDARSYLPYQLAI